MPSFSRKNLLKPSRLIWRMSDDSPMGEWVDPNTPPPAPKKKAVPPPADRPHDTTFTSSSFDLLKGVEVQDSGDTVPDELFDELFGRPAAGGSRRTPS